MRDWKVCGGGGAECVRERAREREREREGGGKRQKGGRLCQEEGTHLVNAEGEAVADIINTLFGAPGRARPRIFEDAEAEDLRLLG